MNIKKKKKKKKKKTTIRIDSVIFTEFETLSMPFILNLQFIFFTNLQNFQTV